VGAFSRRVSVLVLGLGALTLSSVTSCQVDNRTLKVAGDGAVGANRDATSSAESGVEGGIESDAGADAEESGPESDAAEEGGLTDSAGGGDGQANGTPCSGASACSSGVCVDGVCCLTACASACSACNVPGSAGTCSPLPSGQSPETGHPTCGPDTKASCARDGTCDGKGACHNWDTTTVCASPSCNATANTAVGASTCDGNGNCVAPGSVLCAPFVCLPDDSACYATCTGTSTGCSSGNVCNAGSCGLKVTGSACTSDGQCSTGECVDSVCCATACPGQCQACDLTGHVGTCTTLPSGPPHGSRPACTTDGTVCGGACGGSPTACTYPGGSTSCRGQSCASAVLSLAAGCNGAGSCPASTQQDCTVPANGSAICSGTACGVTCNTYYAPSGNTCALTWTAESTPSSELLGIWGSSATDIYAIDYQHIYHSTGNGVWTTSFTGTFAQSFSGIWGDAYTPTDIYVVGDTGTIFQTTDDGQTWTQQTDPNDGNNYYTVTGNGSTATGSAPLEVYALGSVYAWFNPDGWQVLGTANGSLNANFVSAYAFYASPYVLAGDDTGTIWASDENGNFTKSYTTGWSTVNGMWGFQPSSGGDIFAVGGGGGIALAITTACSAGSTGPVSCTWSQQTSGTTQTLNGVYGVQSGGSGPFTYFAVGNAGTILSSTGNGTWTAQTSNTTANLTGVWAATPTNVFACGANGKVMHYNGP
jgi:photosystem II stability/assembly factor-like uncharacterized protein